MSGVIEYDAKVASADAVFEAALEAGADDVVSGDSGHEVYAVQDRFGSVAKALEAKFGEPRKASLVWRPQNTVALDDEQGESSSSSSKASTSTTTCKTSMPISRFPTRW